MACRRCPGDYVVGEGGRLECSRCGHIVGDISLLFEEKPFEDLNQYRQPDNEASNEYISSLSEDLAKLA